VRHPPIIPTCAPDDRLGSRLAAALAVNLCVILAVYGRDEGMSGVEREALRGLERAVA
jgi:hypothetical protein